MTTLMGMLGAAAASVKSFKTAVASGLAHLKGSGAKHIVVAVRAVFLLQLLPARTLGTGLRRGDGGPKRPH